MKVLLIVPTYKYKSNYPAFLSVTDFPQGYAYIAAALKNAGHEVVGLNLNNITGHKTAYDMIVNKVAQVLENHNPDMVGIGGLCIDYTFIKDAMAVVRQFSKAPIVLGGGIVTHDAEFIMDTLKPEYGIMGEAEKAMVSLANLEACDNISNLAYWRQGELRFTKQNWSYAPIDDIPFPDYEPFDIGNMVDNYSPATRVLYRYTRLMPRPFIITTARSCPFRCTFCVHDHGPKYRARSIPNIMSEIKQNYEAYRFNILIIQDELFAVNTKRMRQFCEALLEGKAKYGWDFDWMFQTHANARLDKETLTLAKQSGCYMFSYGLESGSPAILKSMNKRTSLGQILDAMHLAESLRLGFGGNLIFGDPAETEVTLRESLDFYYRYCLDKPIFLSLVMAYPGSKIFADAVAKKVIPDKLQYYEQCDEVVYNLTNMPSEVWQKWMMYLLATEAEWFTRKQVDVKSIAKDGGSDAMSVYYEAEYYSIKAECPFCNQLVEYRQMLNDPYEVGRLYLGTCCPKCGKVVRINLNKVAVS